MDMKSYKGAYGLLISISIAFAIFFPHLKMKFFYTGLVWGTVLTINYILGKLMKQNKLTPINYVFCYSLMWVIAAYISIRLIY